MNEGLVPTTRVGRLGERFVAILSLGAVLASAICLRPGAVFAGSVALLAVAWGTIPFAINSFLTPISSKRPPRPRPSRSESRSVTTIVCVGGEPLDIARASIVLASETGPTLVATASQPNIVDQLGLADVPIFVSATPEAALNEAVNSVITPAVFVTSASAFSVREVDHLAGLLSGSVGWAIGRAQPFTQAAFAPGRRADHAARVRSRARAAGLVMWEPDATIVSTRLLQGCEFEPGRPRGAVLRTIATAGYEGVERSTVIAMRSVPTDGPLFWPSEVMRTRGVVADLSDATHTRSLRVRLLALSGLAREFVAWQFLLWLSVPVVLAWAGAFPFRIGVVAFGSIHIALAAARWVSSRVSVGTELHPLQEAVASAYEAPASLLALSSLRGRIRPLRFEFPGQPLLYAAIALSVVIALPLLDRPPTADSGIDASVATAVLALAAMWVCAVHAVGPRAWGRTAYRLATDAGAEVAGEGGRLREASPNGAAVIGRFSHHQVGDLVSLSVSFPDRPPMKVAAIVASHRRCSHSSTVLGLVLSLDPHERVFWIRSMFDARQLTPLAPRDAARVTVDRRRLPRAGDDIAAHRSILRFVRSVQVAVVGLMSLTMLAAVTLAMIGDRPYVMRSGSMTPALSVGDIAIVHWVHATDVRVGDVIMFRDPQLERQTITHRVRTIKAERGRRRFETRGDANESSEVWTKSDRALLGRVVASVPAAGRIVAYLGRFRGPIAGVALALALLAAILAAHRESGRRTNRHLLEPAAVLAE